VAVRTDIDRIRRDFTKIINQSIDSKTMQFIGQLAAIVIARRTNQGFGVRRFLGSKNSLISMRQYNPKYLQSKKKAKLSGDIPIPQGVNYTRTKGAVIKNFNGRRVNLTYTGQLLASIQAVNVSNKSVDIEPTGSRSDGKSNKEVARELQKRGWVFMNLAKSEFSFIIDEYNNYIQRRFKEFFK
jgi:hypothetical protein